MTAPVKHIRAALLVVYVVWGSTYFGIKIAVETMPPLLAAGSRFLTAGALLALILAVRGTSLRISRRELGASAIARRTPARPRRRARARRGDADRLERRGDDRRNGSAADHRDAACSRRKSCSSDAPEHACRSPRTRARRRARSRRQLDCGRPRRDGQRDDVLVDGVVPLEATLAPARPLRRDLV